MPLDKKVEKRFFGLVRDRIKDAIEAVSVAGTMIGYGALVGIIALAATSQKADAVSPLTDVPSSSTPIAAIAAPNTTSYGNLTGGAGGIIDSEGKVTDNWIATTDYGYIHKYEGQSLIASIDTGISGLSGAVYLGKDNSGNDKFALSAQRDIYEGTLTSSWTTEHILGVNGISSDLADVSFYNGNYFAPTKGNGIVRIDPVSGDSVVVRAQNGWESAEYITFVPGIYDNDMVQLEGENYVDVDSDGVFFGSGKLSNLHSLATIEGVAYYGNNGNGFTNMAAIQDEGFQIHDNSALAYMDNMQAIPPRTLRSDINNNGSGDGIVDFQDLCILANEWLTPGVYANFNDDEIVNIGDFCIMANEWLQTESWYVN